MSINIRMIKSESYVTETRRTRGKVVTTHLGPYKNSFVRLLYRTSQLQNAVAKRLRVETTGLRNESRDIEHAMSLLEKSVSHLPILVRLTINQPWAPRPMQSPDQEQCISFDPLRSERVRQALLALPAKRAFGRLCRDAGEGSPDAITQFRELANHAPGLLDSLSDLVRFARSLVLSGISGDHLVFRQALEAKMDSLEVNVKKDQARDPILGMAAELVAISYLDAMRCSLLAAKDYENRTDAEHFQSLADRSLRRFERCQQAYENSRQRMK